MIDLDYAARHLRGVWRLIKGDEDWQNDIDQTVDGVFASFWTMALSVPFIVLGTLTQHRICLYSDTCGETIFDKASAGMVAGIDLMSAMTSWLMSLLILAYIARQLDATRSVATLIIANNWGQLLVYSIILAPALLIFTTHNAFATVTVFLSIYAFSIFAFWMVLRRILPISVPLTTALIIAMTALSMGVHTLISSFALAIF